MPVDFPLWRLKPEDAARIIILEPLKPIERHKFWRKRDMRIKASPRSAPRQDDLKTLASAKKDSQWEAWAEEWAEAFPRIGVLIGPLLKDGRFWSQSQSDRPANPLASERPRDAWGGLYSRDQYEIDVAYYQAGRDLLLENFYLGQTGDGPYLDGLVYKRTDDLLLAEMEFCKAKLRFTWAVLEARRKEKGKAPRAKKDEHYHWQNIGSDEAIAMQFKHSGYEIRKIDTLSNRHYEVRLK